MKLKFKGAEIGAKKPAVPKQEGALKLKGGDFLDILRRIHLGGLIEGCVLEISNMRVSSMAVDPTNTIFLTAGKMLKGIGFDSIIGIGNLDLLIKFLAVAKDEEITLNIVDERRLIVDRGSRGQLDFLLTETDLIPTRFDPGEEGLQKLLESGIYKVVLTDEIRQDYLQYFSIIGSKELTLIHNKGKVLFSGGSSAEHQFHLPVGAIEGSKAGNKAKFKMQFYGDYLAAIMKVIEFETATKVAMYFDEGKPLIVMQDNSNIWALLPVVEAGGEPIKEDDDIPF